MRPSILLVDDEPACLAAVREFFSHLDYAVFAAQELEEAEALIITRDFSLVIADLSLTAFNADEGFRLIDLIGERSPQTKIILLSGRASPEIRDEALKRGAHAVLRKPQRMADVGAIAEQLLGAGNV